MTSTGNERGPRDISSGTSQNKDSAINSLFDARPIQPTKAYSEERACIKCGTKYILNTPYEKCNEIIRDLCMDCIFETVNFEENGGKS